MKPILISPSKPVGKIVFLLLFVIICVGGWYIAEMFSLFSFFAKEMQMDSYPKYLEYFGIGIIAWVLAYIMFSVIKSFQFKKLNLLKFSINLAVDSSYHFVQSPAGITSADFLKLFFKYLKDGENKEKYSKVLHHYYPMLEIRRNDKVIQFGGEETLLTGGLHNGDICQIVGRPKK